jgi:hypothetical protein
MTVWEAIRALDERKAAALGDPDHQRTGERMSDEEYRCILVGLDLDLAELDDVAQAMARYASALVSTGNVSLPEMFTTLVRDMIISGVLYDRARQHQQAPA